MMNIKETNKDPFWYIDEDYDHYIKLDMLITTLEFITQKHLKNNEREILISDLKEFMDLTNDVIISIKLS